jgi:geranylgeranyl pyrophosphate synthase
MRLVETSLSSQVELLGAVEACMLELVGGAEHDVCARMATEHLSTGGKRLRALLALEAMAALGQDPAVIVPWAAACELLHNASLIHDDLQDGDRTRRGRPALWTQWGAAQAINAGDLLLVLPALAAMRVEVPGERRLALVSCLTRNASQTVRGQAYELHLRGDVRMERDAYLRAAIGKTAGLFGLPVEGAALAAGLDAEVAAALAAPFERLGLLYQLQDDVIDLFGDKGREDRGADIREGKVSALVVAHVALHPRDRLWLAGILRTPRENTSAEMVGEVIERFATGGALEHVLGWIDEIATEEHPLLEAYPALDRVAALLRGRFLGPLASVREQIALRRRSA